MIDFIPIIYYAKVFFYTILVIILFSWFRLSTTNKIKNATLGAYVLVLFCVFYIGLRPIHSIFVDMLTYNQIFENIVDGYQLTLNGDVGFDTYIKFSANLMTAEFFFLSCAFLYVFPLYLVSKRLFKVNWFYSFLILVASFSFWAYGTNGIRNGIATSFVLLAFAYTDRKVIMIALMLLGASFHKSMLLPVAAYVFTLFYNNSKKYLSFWILCIPLSLLAGGVFETFFGSVGFADERLSYLTSGNINDDEFSSTGFRWDFLVYSAIPVFAGWYFIVKKNFKDLLYQQLLNIYLIANGFWILVIRANFSNRFAYLSWFMMGLLIIYPFLKSNLLVNQARKMGLVLFLYFMFTFVMAVILTKK